jgi:hypothetical protein
VGHRVGGPCRPLHKGNYFYTINNNFLQGDWTWVRRHASTVKIWLRQGGYKPITKSIAAKSFPPPQPTQDIIQNDNFRKSFSGGTRRLRGPFLVVSISPLVRMCQYTNITHQIDITARLSSWDEIFNGVNISILHLFKAAHFFSAMLWNELQDATANGASGLFTCWYYWGQEVTCRLQILFRVYYSRVYGSVKRRKGSCGLRHNLKNHELIGVSGENGG